MVNDIRLYIDTELVEFKETPEILYNWTETDFTNPIVTKNSYSKTIRIQGTKQNNKIFGHFWNLERYQLYGGNTGTYFNPSYKVPFSLYVNGNLFEKGYVKLQKVTHKNDDFEYEIGLFGGLGSFLYNLSVNEDDGSIKTFNSLNFYLNNSLVDFGFNINKEAVKEAWDNIDNTSSKWSILNFAPAYTGVPDKFDANKVLINFKDFSASTFTQEVFEDGYYYYPQGGMSGHTEGFSIGELSDSLDSWQVKDLRSYMQVPVLKVKSIFDALQRPENSKGEFDNGYELVLDQDFFNSNNPYYEDAYISLPKITTLTFTEQEGEETIVTAYTSTTTTDYGVNNTVTENTTLTFILPETINTGNNKARITCYLYNTVTRPDTPHPTARILYLQPNFVGEELRWFSENRTALGAQLLAYSANDSLLTGSSIDWYTSMNLDGVYFSCQEAINDGSYRPKYNTTVINKKTGAFTFVSTADTGSIYSFNNPISIELDIPVGTKKISLNIQRCSEVGENHETMYGNKLFEYGNRDTTELTYRGVFNSSRTEGLLTASKENGESNFYSNKYVSQNELFTTDYSISDWLISYCKMFGLYIHKDVVEDKIYIDTRNNYYQKNLVEDISGLIDYSKDFTINPVYISNKFYTLTNPMEKNKYSETYLSNNGNEYGMKLINTGFDFEASRKELLNNFKIKTGIPVNRQDIYNFKPLDGVNPYVYNGFSYKLYANGDIDYEKTHDIEIDKKQIVKVYRNNFFNIDYPYYDAFYKMCFENEGKEINSANVFLFFNGFKRVEDFGYYLTDDLGIMSKLNNNPCWIMTKSETSQDDVSVGIELTDIPLFSSYFAPDGNIKFSSNFGSPRELFVRKDELVNNDDSTLYSQFYSSYYEDLFNINTKVVDCYVMPVTILNSENLRKFYWFDNAIWRLNKITDYSPVENRTVKCQFVKIQDMDAIGNYIPNKHGFLSVTLDKYVVANTGETINGRVTCNGDWNYVSSDYNDVIVTPESGTGSQDISVTIPFYSSTVARTINMDFRSGNDRITVSVEQPAGAEKFFYWIGVDTSAYTTTVTTGFTSLTLGYNTNYDNVSFVPQSSDITYRADGPNQITALFSANTGDTAKVMTINVISGGLVIGYVTITQEGQLSNKYFRWTATQQSGYTPTVTAGFTSYTATFETNYGDLEYDIQSSDYSDVYLRIDGPNQITAQFTQNIGDRDRVIRVNIYSNNILVGNLTITQESTAGKYFRWNATQQSAYTETLTAGFTSLTAGYDTNYEDVSLVSQSSDITYRVDGPSQITAIFSANTGSSPKVMTINAYSDNILVGYLTITQEGIVTYYFEWTATQDSAYTPTVTAGFTSYTASYSTNYEDLTFNAQTTDITYRVDGPNQITAIFSANTGDRDKVMTINVYKGTDLVGYLTITQESAVGQYFRWNATHESAYTETLTAGFTSLTAGYDTNYENVTFTPQSSEITYRVDTPSQITAIFSANTGNRDKVMTINAYSGTDLIGYLTITQEGIITNYFEWTDTQQSAYTPTVTPETTTFTTGYDTNYRNLNFNAQTSDISFRLDSSNQIITSFSANTSDRDKVMTINVYNGNDLVGSLTITQESTAGQYFRWNATQQSAYTTTLTAGFTSLTVGYDTNYEDVSLVSQSSDITYRVDGPSQITAIFSANTGSSPKVMTINAYSGTDLIGYLTITQEGQT